MFRAFPPRANTARRERRWRQQVGTSWQALHAPGEGAPAITLTLTPSPRPQAAMEKRVEYILNCASTALGVRASAANGTSREVTDFLEVPTVRLLQVWANGEGLQFATTTSLSDKSIATAVVFTKRAAEPVTAENVASVVLMSKVSSPLETLQLAITQLYGPVLLQSGQLDAKTSGLLEQLEAGLAS